MRFFVTPKPGLSIRDPLNPAVRLPAEGDWREDSTAWRRLARTGDVVITAGPAPESKKK